MKYLLQGKLYVMLHTLLQDEKPKLDIKLITNTSIYIGGERILTLGLFWPFNTFDFTFIYLIKVFNMPISCIFISAKTFTLTNCINITSPVICLHRRHQQPQQLLLKISSTRILLVDPQRAHRFVFVFCILWLVVASRCISGL